MNRIILTAQILGALIFGIAFTATAQQLRAARIGYEVFVEDTKMVKLDGQPMPTAFQPDGKRHRLELRAVGTEGLFDMIDPQGQVRRGGQSQHHFINLRVGNRQFQLRNALITEIGFPALYFNPKELSVDKAFIVKLDAEISSFSPDTGQKAPPKTSNRSFTGIFKGEVVGVEAAVFSKVSGLKLPLRAGPSGTTNRRGSFQVEMTKEAAAAAKFGGGPGGSAQARKVRLTIFDEGHLPLTVLTFTVHRARPLEFTSAEGRSMSFELFFDTYEKGND